MTTPAIRSAAARADQPTISIVIPAFNRKDQVVPTLRHMLAAMEKYGRAELIVVDNGSSDGTWEWMAEELSGRAVLLRHTGVTISALRNLGAARATGEYISFVDSDCLVPADYYDRVAEVFATVPTDVAGCMYGLPEDVHWIEETWMLLNCPLREGYATLLPGGSMVVRRAVFERVRGFDERLVTGEDAELCQRILDAGFKIYETHRLAIVHLRNMNSLPGFFRKQVWHSLGMFGTARSWRLDRVVLMTLAHLILTLAAVAWIAFGVDPILQRVAIATALILAVPATTVAYRVAARGGAFIPIRSTVLYATYYYARIWGFVKILRGARQ